MSIILFPIVAIVLLGLLIAVPVGIITLLVWPEARAMTKSLLVRASPFALVGLLLLIVIGTKHDTVHRVAPKPLPPHAPPDVSRLEASRVEPGGPGQPKGPASRSQGLQAFEFVDEGPASARPLAAAHRADVDVSLQMHQTGLPATWLSLAPIVLTLVIGFSALALRKQNGSRYWLAGAVLALMVGGFSMWFFGGAVQVNPVASSRSVQQAVPEPLQARFEPRAGASATSLMVQTDIDGVVPIDGTAATALPLETTVPASSTVPVSILAFTGDDEQGASVSELPDWVRDWENSALEADWEKYVLVSRRYATVPEAEDELLATLRPRLAAYLSRGGTPVSPESLTLDDLRRSSAVTSWVQETFQVDLGSSLQPVYRVTWKVWLRPSVREALGESWRLVQREDRLWKVGGLFGGLTVLFGAAALVLHHGRPRP